MNNLEIYQKLFSTKRILIKGKSYILDSGQKKIVIKKNSKDIKSLFSYLSSRGYYFYPKLLDSFSEDEIVYEYASSNDIPTEQKLNDFASVVGLLHSKTVFFKEIDQDKYLQLKDDILNNIIYLKNYYDSLFMEILKKEYPKPIEYYYARNYSIILNNLKFCEEKLENWYELVKNKENMRVCIVHNNLSLDHFIENEEKYLISWDSFITDSPIFDILGFCKSSQNINTSLFLKKYFEVFPYQEEEKILFEVLLMIPPYFEIDDFINLKNNIIKLYDTSKIVYKLEEEKI